MSLSKHFQVEVGVVNCESLSVLVYGTDSGFNQRIYVLYTGQHYDPIVGINTGLLRSVYAPMLVVTSFLYAYACRT